MSKVTKVTEVTTLSIKKLVNCTEVLRYTQIDTKEVHLAAQVMTLQRAFEGVSHSFDSIQAHARAGSPFRAISFPAQSNGS